MEWSRRELRISDWAADDNVAQAASLPLCWLLVEICSLAIYSQCRFSQCLQWNEKHREAYTCLASVFFQKNMKRPQVMQKGGREAYSKLFRLDDADRPGE
jgi:hypothetical protein